MPNGRGYSGQHFTSLHVGIKPVKCKGSQFGPKFVIFLPFCRFAYTPDLIWCETVAP